MKINLGEILDYLEEGGTVDELIEEYFGKSREEKSGKEVRL